MGTLLPPSPQHLPALLPILLLSPSPPLTLSPLLIWCISSTLDQFQTCVSADNIIMPIL